MNKNYPFGHAEKCIDNGSGKLVVCPEKYFRHGHHRKSLVGKNADTLCDIVRHHIQIPRQIPIGNP